MKLYYSPGTIARASLIALCEAKADFTPVKLDFTRTEQQGAAYKAINPKGRVPALIDGDRTLTETPAILHYVSQRFPEAGMMPANPWEQARVHELMSYLASTVHVAHAHKRRGSRWASREDSFRDMGDKVAANMTDCFTLIEEAYCKGDFAIGDSLTVADPYLFVVSCWLEGDGVDIARFPGVAGHHAAMKARPAVQRALELEEA